jgi:hypothetical protein
MQLWQISYRGKVEQWLAEGKCEVLPVGEEGGETEFDLLKVVPERSIVELVASRLVKEEGGMALEDVSFDWVCCHSSSCASAI